METIDKPPAVGRGSGILSAVRRDALVPVLVLGIVALALGLRLYGLDWDRGFPYTPHPDERAILSKVEQISPPALGDLGVLLDADESPWNPRWFPYGSFPLYLLKGVQLVSSLEPGEGLKDLRIAGRAISALADVGTVMLVFALGSRIYGRRVGVLASLLTAIAVIHIQLSHFFAVDTLLALFAVAAIYFMFRVATEGRLRDSVLAGVFIGLGLATKVSLLPIYSAFFVAHLMYVFAARDTNGATPAFNRRWSAAVQGLALGAAASLLVLFIVQPYMFLDWSRFYEDVIEQSEMVRRIRDYPYTRQYIDTTPYWYHVRQLATWGLGWPLGIVAWTGLVYASLRGMRLRYGLAYLVLGWGLPMAILLPSESFLATIAAAVIGIAALLATLPLRSPDSRADVLLLSWVAPLFLITGTFQVKFIRYLLPITPFLLLFGSRMLVALWDRAGRANSRTALRRGLAAGLVLLVGSTGFYALAYQSVYREPHTAVRAAEWINRNAPKGSVILKEHWEEGLPELVGYRTGTSRYELRLYDGDGPQKLQELSDKLAEADYLVFFSNRLYGTIPRLPERYPITAEYYRSLFSGRLGYELADFEVSYPRLLGVGLAHDTFSRPGLPEPEALRGQSPAPLTVDLGFADESFTVYDHPTVLVFRNAERHDDATIRQILDAAAPPRAPPDKAGDAQEIGLMLSARDAEAQQRGGTWSDIVRPGSWTNRVPVLAWLILVEGIGLLSLPIAFYVFRPLPDRGYFFSKALGLLMVGLVVWLLASLRWMAFSRGSISVALLLLALVAALIVARKRHEMAAFVRERWTLLAIGEIVFLLAFFSFVMVRMANPDLWHPFRGGEKPMDFAYLNAVLRSSYMPPYDPWFGGGYLNYYYWGQFIVAMLIKATGIEPGVAYNLAVPLFFALTAAGAFAVVYGLAEGTRRRLQTTASSAASPLTVGPGQGPEGGRGTRWSPVVAGIGGALFVTVLGNLDGAIQVGWGAWRAIVQKLPFGAFDFWRSSRMMPPDPPGHEITEFPFFTFLFADLHAHLVAMPFTLLALGLALAIVMGAARRRRRGAHWSIDEAVRLAVLGVVVGALRLLNTWDYPTYLLIGIAAVLIAEFFVHGGLGLVVIARWGVKSLLVLIVGYVLFLPFHLTNETFFLGVESTTNSTVLWQFLAIAGLFVFVIASFFASESRSWLAAANRDLRERLASTVRAVSSADDEAPTSSGEPSIGVGWLLGMVLGALLLGYGIAAIVSSEAGGSTIPFLIVLLALVSVSSVKWLADMRPDAPLLVFVAAVVAVALGLVLGLDVVRVEGDIDRMNSVFKFYLQVWVLLAVAAAYLLWRLFNGRRVPLRRTAWGKKLWLGALAVLLASASIYPVMGTQDRLRDRFNGQVLPLTLDGTAYLDGTVYRDAKGDIDLAADYEGIRWLLGNVEGSPIILEGLTPTYHWGSRVSIYTGLPSVVGWEWHQQQQRWGYRQVVDQRIRDVNRIYRTVDPSEALKLMRQYGVRYVYVGQLERLYYPGNGLDKFDGALSEEMDKIFESPQVAIYRLH